MVCVLCSKTDVCVACYVCDVFDVFVRIHACLYACMCEVCDVNHVCCMSCE